MLDLNFIENGGSNVCLGFEDGFTLGSATELVKAEKQHHILVPIPSHPSLPTAFEKQQIKQTSVSSSPPVLE